MKMADFISNLSEKMGVSKAEAERVYKLVLGSMFDAVVEDGSLRTEYGTLSVATRAARPARTGRNPRTGEALEIPASPEKKVVKFTSSKSLKEQLN